MAKFIGRATIVPAEDLGDRAAVTIAGVRREISTTRPGEAMKAPLAVLRPDALEISTDDASAWRGKVVNRRFTGGTAVYRVRTSDGVELEVASSDMRLREGDLTGVIVAREPVPLVSSA